MNKKKKINIVVIVPVIVTVIIACAVIYFVLQAASASGNHHAAMGEHEPPPLPTEASLEKKVQDRVVIEEVAAVEHDCDFDDWVGKAVNEDSLSETERPFRVLSPGSVVTMDYNPERINIHTDDEGTVAYITCG